MPRDLSQKKEKQLTKKLIVKKIIEESRKPKKVSQEKIKQEPGFGSYRITVRPKNQYTTFRTQQIAPWLERIAGRNYKGKRYTVTRLVGKQCARLDERENLIVTDKHASIVLKHIDGIIKPIDWDIFKAKPSFFAPELTPPVDEQPRKSTLAPVKKVKEYRAPAAKPLTKPTKKTKILAAKTQARARRK